MKTAIIKKALLGVSLAAVAAITVVAGVLPADVSAASCRRTDIGMGNQTAMFFGDETLDYWRSTQLVVPSSSGCSSIYVANVVVPGDTTNDPTCVAFRLRFYPTSGGSTLTRFQDVCSGSGWTALATNVMNGTRYVVEAVSRTNVNYRPYYTIYD